MQMKIENNEISYIHEPPTPNLSYIMAMPFPPPIWYKEPHYPSHAPN